MKGVVRSIHEWVEQVKSLLRGKLDALPQRTKLIMVLTMFVLFALCALYTPIAAFYEFGNGSSENMEIEHIRQLDLPYKQDSINLNNIYNYGTEQESYNLSERGES